MAVPGTAHFRIQAARYKIPQPCSLVHVWNPCSGPCSAGEGSPVGSTTPFPRLCPWDSAPTAQELPHQGQGSCDVPKSLADVFLGFPQTYIAPEDQSPHAASQQMANDPGQKTWKVPFARHSPAQRSTPGCLPVSNSSVSLVACLILSFPGHSHARYCFKMSADSAFKTTSLFNILTGSLGQADMAVMKLRGGKQSYGAVQIGLKNEEMVPT